MCGFSRSCNVPVSAKTEWSVRRSTCAGERTGSRFRTRPFAPEMSRHCLPIACFHVIPDAQQLSIPRATPYRSYHSEPMAPALSAILMRFNFGLCNIQRMKLACSCLSTPSQLKLANSANNQTMVISLAVIGCSSTWDSHPPVQSGDTQHHLTPSPLQSVVGPLLIKSTMSLPCASHVL